MSRPQTGFESTNENLHEIFETLKALAYYASILVLLALGILSLITLLHAFVEAWQGITGSLFDMQNIHMLITAVIDDEAALGAFGILIANLTFLARHISNSIALRNCLVQEQRWHFEKSKIIDDDMRYQSQKRHSPCDVDQELLRGT